jgi:negative regulator of sigma-B (phosphoserine phosphatase)
MDEQRSAGLRPLIDWALAASQLEGESRSGDLHVVKEFPGGTLIGVVDGLGHGVEAGATADEAVAELEAHAADDVVSLMTRCHERLRGLRGAAITLVSIRNRDLTMSSLAVGNVEAVVVRDGPTGADVHESVVQRGGVVGFQLPRLQASTTRLSPGDTLILATDGIRPGFTHGVAISGPIQRSADRILKDFRRTSDDALVLVARVQGGRP